MSANIKDSIESAFESSSFKSDKSNPLEKEHIIKVAFGISFVTFCLVIAFAGAIHLGW